MAGKVILLGTSGEVIHIFDYVLDAFEIGGLVLSTGGAAYCKITAETVVTKKMNPKKKPKPNIRGVLTIEQAEDGQFFDIAATPALPDPPN